MSQTVVRAVDVYAEEEAQKDAARRRFAADVVDAEMTVLRNEGLYRHLRFDFPRATWDSCEIVTWPYTLVIQGGLGLWPFGGLYHREDMLDLFRRPRVEVEYWEDRLFPPASGIARQFAEERVPAYIRHTVAEAADEYPNLAEQVEDELLGYFADADLSTEIGAAHALGRFEGDDGFHFDIENWNLREYDPWFLLACNVLPWAVDRYDTMPITNT